MAKENKQEASVKVNIKKLDKGTMFLHEQLASGTFGKKKFTVDRVMQNGNIILNVGKFEDHQRYMLTTSDIVQAMLDFHFDGGGKDIKVKPMKTIKKP